MAPRLVELNRCKISATFPGRIRSESPPPIVRLRRGGARCRRIGVLTHDRVFCFWSSSEEFISRVSFDLAEKTSHCSSSSSLDDESEMFFSFGVSTGFVMAGSDWIEIEGTGSEVATTGVTVVRGKLSSEILCCLSWGVCNWLDMVKPPVEPLFRWNDEARGGSKLIGVIFKALDPPDGLGKDWTYRCDDVVSFLLPEKTK